MKKNIIIITNLCSGNIAIEVENYSDENVKRAIREMTGIKTDDLQCLACSISESLYEVKKCSLALKEDINSPKIAKNLIALEIIHAKLY